MKLIVLICLLPFAIAPLHAGVCKGNDPCTACQDCTKCQYCAVQKKGSCGICRNQNSEQSNARAKKLVASAAR